VLTSLKNSLIKSGIELSIPSQQIILQTLSGNGKSEYSDDQKILLDGKL
jgi:hypothetical protein